MQIEKTALNKQQTNAEKRHAEYASLGKDIDNDHDQRVKVSLCTGGNGTIY